MNWKFWERNEVGDSCNSPLRTNVQLFDPSWPEKRRLFLDRLRNTPETDALMAGYLGLIDQEILVQIQKCERPGLSDAEAHGICAALGLLKGLRGDLQHQWNTARKKQADEDRKAA